MKKVISAIGAILPLAAAAHPGHGSTDGYTIIHYMKEPQHIVLGVLIIGFVVLLAKAKRNSEANS